MEEQGLRVKALWSHSPLVPILSAIAVLGGIASLARSETTHPASSAVQAAWPIIAATAGTVLVVGGAAFLWFVREIEFYPKYLRIKIGFRTVTLAWDDLVPPRGVSLAGIKFSYLQDGQLRDDAELIMTRSLARILLRHPSCPRFRMDPKVWLNLGLPNPFDN